MESKSCMKKGHIVEMTREEEFEHTVNYLEMEYKRLIEEYKHDDDICSRLKNTLLNANIGYVVYYSSEFLLCECIAADMADDIQHFKKLNYTRLTEQLQDILCNILGTRELVDNQSTDDEDGIETANEEGAHC